jgi:hypothetical protein
MHSRWNFDGLEAELQDYGYLRIHHSLVQSKTDGDFGIRKYRWIGYEPANSLVLTRICVVFGKKRTH